MNKTIKNISYIIFVFIGIIAVGILIWQGKKPVPIAVQPTPTPTVIVSESPTPTPSSDTSADQGVLSGLGGQKLTDLEMANLKTYSSSQLGISMKIPEKMFGVNNCMDSGSTEKIFSVLSKVFEDTTSGTIFVTPEYYYADTNQVGSCKKVVYSLDSLRKQTVPSSEILSIMVRPQFGWAIKIKNVKSDAELSEFIKNAFGSGCFVEKKTPWVLQEGVYEITIKGEDWDKITDPSAKTTCFKPMTLSALLYAPEKGKLMFLNLGQEPTFFTDSTNSHAYDPDMLKSFRFE